jgi:hypothetical protein
MNRSKSYSDFGLLGRLKPGSKSAYRVVKWANDLAPPRTAKRGELLYEDFLLDRFGTRMSPDKLCSGCAPLEGTNLVAHALEKMATLTGIETILRGSHCLAKTAF